VKSVPVRSFGVSKKEIATLDVPKKKSPNKHTKQPQRGSCTQLW
jgi:hypothetical protein